MYQLGELVVANMRPGRDWCEEREELGVHVCTVMLPRWDGTIKVRVWKKQQGDRVSWVVTEPKGFSEEVVKVWVKKKAEAIAEAGGICMAKALKREIGVS